MTLPLFLLPDGALHGIEEGRHLELAGQEARHAADVRRLRRGEEIDVADGSGRVARCRIATVATHGVELHVLRACLVPDRSPRLVLVQALAKGGRDELAVRTATELGADEIVPWQAARCVVRWQADRRERGLRRWRSTVREATKQSRRPTLPAVRGPLDTPGLARRVPAAALALVLHEDAAVPLSEVLRDAGTVPPEAGTPVLGGTGTAGPADTATTCCRVRDLAGDVLVVVGPEGGIGQEELASLTLAGARAVRLGPEVLRTSSAGPAALAVLSTFLGRW